MKNEKEEPHEGSPSQPCNVCGLHLVMVPCRLASVQASELISPDSHPWLLAVPPNFQGPPAQSFCALLVSVGTLSPDRLGIGSHEGSHLSRAHSFFLLRDAHPDYPINNVDLLPSVSSTADPLTPSSFHFSITFVPFSSVI